MSEFSEEVVQKKISDEFNEHCNSLTDISKSVKKDQDTVLHLSNASAEVKAPVAEGEDEDLATKRIEIEDLKRQIKKLEVEIESTKKQGSSKSRQSAALCKLLTEMELIESKTQYLGMSTKNTEKVFSYNVENPNVADLLWSKLESP